MRRITRGFVGLGVVAGTALAMGLTGPGRGSPAVPVSAPASEVRSVAASGPAEEGTAGEAHQLPAHPPRPVIVDGIATFDRTVGLAALAGACAETAMLERPGAVVLRGGLRDAHAQVTITVPCSIQLPLGADIHLQHVTLASQTLNIGDGAYAAGENHIDLDQVQFTGPAATGLLIELSDPADRVEIRHSSLTYPLGIAIQAIGQRVAPDQGGAVHLLHSRLASPGENSDGITVVASTSRGLVRAHHSEFDADRIALLADACSVDTGRRRIDCRAATLAAELKRQAEQAMSEQ